MTRREKRRAKRRARSDARAECFDLWMAAVAYTALTYVDLVTQISSIYRCDVRLGKLIGAVVGVVTVVPLVGVAVHYWRKLRKEMKRILSENRD